MSGELSSVAADNKRLAREAEAAAARSKSWFGR